MYCESYESALKMHIFPENPDFLLILMYFFVIISQV